MRYLMLSVSFTAVLFIAVVFVGLPFNVGLGSVTKSQSGWSFSTQSFGLLGMLKRADSFSLKCGDVEHKAVVLNNNVYKKGLPIFFRYADSRKMKTCKSPKLNMRVSTKDWIIVSLIRS